MNNNKGIPKMSVPTNLIQMQTNKHRKKVSDELKPNICFNIVIRQIIADEKSKQF